MNCLILGGAGFIGSHLAEGLLEAGHQVRIFDRPNVIRPSVLTTDTRVEWLEGDFTNEEDLSRVIAGSHAIFHLAYTTLPRSSNDNPIYDVQTNLIGTLRLLDLAKAAAVRKIVFVSSGGTVYGATRSDPIPETNPTEPIVSYGITKLAIEKYLHMYSVLYGLDYCVLRLANPFGERQRVAAAQGAVTVFLHKALHAETIEIWGDGSVRRDYIYIKDVVGAFLRALSYDGTQRVFNIGSGQGRSLNEILVAIEQLLGRPVARVHKPARNFDVPSNVLDISRAREVLRWAPAIPFNEGLARTLHWLRAEDCPPSNL
jgi:UDP-glucose 4-epimerase